jgi:hypothetical protein
MGANPRKIHLQESFELERDRPSAVPGAAMRHMQGRVRHFDGGTRRNRHGRATNGTGELLLGAGQATRRLVREGVNTDDTRDDVLAAIATALAEQPWRVLKSLHPCERHLHPDRRLSRLHACLATTHEHYGYAGATRASSGMAARRYFGTAESAVHRTARDGSLTS